MAFPLSQCWIYDDFIRLGMFCQSQHWDEVELLRGFGIAFKVYCPHNFCHDCTFDVILRKVYSGMKIATNITSMNEYSIPSPNLVSCKHSSLALFLSLLHNFFILDTEFYLNKCMLQNNTLVRIYCLLLLRDVL